MRQEEHGVYPTDSLYFAFCDRTGTGWDRDRTTLHFCACHTWRHLCLPYTTPLQAFSRLTHPPYPFLLCFAFPHHPAHPYALPLPSHPSTALVRTCFYMAFGFDRLHCHVAFLLLSRRSVQGLPFCAQHVAYYRSASCVWWRRAPHTTCTRTTLHLLRFCPSLAWHLLSQHGTTSPACHLCHAAAAWRALPAATTCHTLDHLTPRHAGCVVRALPSSPPAYAASSSPYTCVSPGAFRPRDHSAYLLPPPLSSSRVSSSADIPCLPGPLWPPVHYHQPLLFLNRHPGDGQRDVNGCGSVDMTGRFVVVAVRTCVAAWLDGTDRRTDRNRTSRLIRTLLARA